MNIMRYAAPSDVSGITLSTGPLTVTDGYVEVPEEATAGDLGGLAVYGFVAAPGTAPSPVAAPSKAKAPDPAIPESPTEPSPQ
jgi:hypothetical protein